MSLPFHDPAAATPSGKWILEARPYGRPTSAPPHIGEFGNSEGKILHAVECYWILTKANDCPLWSIFATTCEDAHCVCAQTRTSLRPSCMNRNDGWWILACNDLLDWRGWARAWCSKRNCVVTVKIARQRGHAKVRSHWHFISTLVYLLTFLKPLCSYPSATSIRVHKCTQLPIIARTPRIHARQFMQYSDTVEWP